MEAIRVVDFPDCMYGSAISLPRYIFFAGQCVFLQWLTVVIQAALPMAAEPSVPLPLAHVPHSVVNKDSF